MTFAAWEEGLFTSGNYFPADLTRDVVIAAERLFAIPERPDRLIAATARWLELPLITRDGEIGAAAGVEVIW
jgi:predicted nucleic acid-binding protein